MTLFLSAAGSCSNANAGRKRELLSGRGGAGRINHRAKLRRAQSPLARALTTPIMNAFGPKVKLTTDLGTRRNMLIFLTVGMRRYSRRFFDKLNTVRPPSGASMRFDGASLRNLLRCGAIIAAIGFAGCSNSCFVGFFNNGQGGVVVKAGNPPPPCSLTQARAAINAVALKSAVCETCTADARVEHVFVTMQSIQLRPTLTDDASKDWLEIAPALADKPRPIDLVGNSLETLVENANIPAQPYREIRLRFCFDAGSNQECHADTPCGETLRNCVRMADGRIEPLRWPGGTPELVIAIRTLEGDSLAVWPDSIIDLRLSLEVRQAFSVSAIQGLRLENVLVGRATAVPRWSTEQDKTKAD